MTLPVVRLREAVADLDFAGVVHVAVGAAVADRDAVERDEPAVGAAVLERPAQAASGIRVRPAFTGVYGREVAGDDRRRERARDRAQHETGGLDARRLERHGSQHSRVPGGRASRLSPYASTARLPRQSQLSDSLEMTLAADCERTARSPSVN